MPTPKDTPYKTAQRAAESRAGRGWFMPVGPTKEQPIPRRGRRQILFQLVKAIYKTKRAKGVY